MANKTKMAESSKPKVWPGIWLVSNRHESKAVVILPKGDKYDDERKGLYLYWWSWLDDDLNI